MAAPFVETVSQAWNFVVVPAVTIALAVSILLFLVQRPAVQPRRWLRRFSRPLPRTLHKQLDTYGVLKVAPVALVFALTVLLYATNFFVSAIGGAIPGRIVYNNAYLLAHAGHPDLLDEMRAARLVNASDPYRAMLQLDRRIQFIAATDSSVVLSGTRYWRDAYGRNARFFTITKFLALWLICAAIFIRRRKIPPATRMGARVATVALLLIGFGLYYVVKQVYAIEQLGYAEVNVLYASLNDPEAARVLLPSNPNQLAGADPRFWDETEHRWWSFRIFRRSYSKWLYQTFVVPASPYQPPPRTTMPLAEPDTTPAGTIVPDTTPAGTIVPDTTPTGTIVPDTQASGGARVPD